jgi:hypothetical protein
VPPDDRCMIAVFFGREFWDYTNKPIVARDGYLR